MPGGRHQQVLGHATVEAEPAPAPGHRGQVRTLAVGLEPVQAVPAGAAAPGTDDRDRLTAVQAPDAGAQGVDPAGVLVAERERGAPGQHAGVEVVHQVQVRVAGPSGTDLDHHLARSRLRHRDVVENRVALPRLQSQRLHVALLRRVGGSTPTLRPDQRSRSGAFDRVSMGRWSLGLAGGRRERGTGSTNPRTEAVMTEQNPHPVVVAVGHDPIDAALAFAAGEAVRAGCGLHLVHVVHRSPRARRWP